VHYLARNAIRPAPSTLPRDTLRDLFLPEGRPYFWLAVETSKVRALRRHLVGGRRVDGGASPSSGYWREGAREAAEGD
jgi:NADPH-dependent ferric siderophore reductase